MQLDTNDGKLAGFDSDFNTMDDAGKEKVRQSLNRIAALCEEDGLTFWEFALVVKYLPVKVSVRLEQMLKSLPYRTEHQ